MLLANEFPPFPGFREEAFTFLRDLETNNERDWFKPRKETYETEVKGPMECLVAEIGRRAQDAGLPLTGSPKQALFRIYRDTRFSKSKRPYKTQQGAFLTRGGNRKENGGLYIHLEPGASFVGGGFYNPDKALLKRWRSEMADRPHRFLEIVDQLEAVGIPLQRRKPLTRMPRGFSGHRERPIATWLKAKGLYAQRPVTAEDMSGPNFVDLVLEVGRRLRPLLEWGWAQEAPLQTGGSLQTEHTS